MKNVYNIGIYVQIAYVNSISFYYRFAKLYIFRPQKRSVAHVKLDFYLLNYNICLNLSNYTVVKLRGLKLEWVV